MSIVLMMALHWFLPLARIVPDPWRYAGLVPLAAGLWLNWAAHDLFERHGTTIDPFGEPTALLTRGPFAYTRNPMYVGGVLILLGLALLLGSATPFVVAPAFAVVTDRRFIRPEEASMTRRFGPEYEAYRQRVRRWL